MTNPTVATTDLAAVHANLSGIRARVGGRKVLAAVKANAYGHGAVPVARMIEATGVADWLGVATVEEALALRQAGVGLPILKFSPAIEDADVEACVGAGIDLPVVDAATIDQVAAAARRVGVAAEVHLKVDTGMRRIGCEPAVAPGLAARADATARIRRPGRSRRARHATPPSPISPSGAARRFRDGSRAIS